METTMIPTKYDEQKKLLKEVYTKTTAWNIAGSSGWIDKKYNDTDFDSIMKHVHINFNTKADILLEIMVERHQLFRKPIILGEFTFLLDGSTSFRIYINSSDPMHSFLLDYFIELKISRNHVWHPEPNDLI